MKTAKNRRELRGTGGWALCAGLVAMGSMLLFAPDRHTRAQAGKMTEGELPCKSPTSAPIRQR
jgi:hypothetical protein